MLLLPLLAQLACNIHATWGPPISGALYTVSTIFISVFENMAMARNCECAGERDFLEGLVVELLASRGEPPPGAVPHTMVGLFESLKARAATMGGEQIGPKSTSQTTTRAHFELNRELGSVDQRSVKTLFL